ncbi:isoprenylcysteine carboxylmethyltransferase family protein [Actinomycetospora endophytica]|uniref:Isoprenylcysteine carboxylmethyltransferase family protein n=1 Tax=Actinomycetospora endophytica TaxID=2291215 RepID=A0ABS8PAX5_9PSEU|nr:isoprenylcysteine carboxylmethyltransferase family protein [Actinomycetospora endophytica]MCD2195289.1 isoprenylcysteine carboxylmethyltransferase family protein [Actinomycetospora endophytica]
MRRPSAAALSAGFFLVAPGTVVGLIPWLITRWRWRPELPGGVAIRVVGAVLVAAGLLPAGSAFVEFVKAGGTPIPLAPTDRLVVSGFNRYVRNPMYVGLLLAVVGQALIFGQARLLVYAAAVWIAPAAFVHWYEEPTLTRRFGTEYEAYRAAVPAWWPRIHPWTPQPERN